MLPEHSNYRSGVPSFRICQDGPTGPQEGFGPRPVKRTTPAVPHGSTYDSLLLWRRHYGLELPLTICRIAWIVVILDRIGADEFLVFVRISVRSQKDRRVFPSESHRQLLTAIDKAETLDKVCGFLGAPSTRSD